MIVVEVGIHDNLNIVGCQTFSFQRIQNKLIAALRRTVRPSFAIDNVVLMKVYKNFPAIVGQLKENDMLQRAVLVSRAGLDGECVIEDLEAQKGRKLNYLSTILTRRETANQDGAEERKECDKR